MLLSVVVPVYNGERYLKDAICSVLRQPCGDLEVICVNDGSTDNCVRILRELAEKDDRIRIISQKNQGVACARNRGIEAAKGKYIAFLDQDDAWCSDVFTSALMETLASSRYDMVSFAYFESNQDMTRGRLIPREIGTRDNLAAYAGENFRHHSSYFYRTDFLRKNKIRVDSYRNEDERFRMQSVYLANCALYLSEPLFIYRNNRLSVTHKGGNVSPVIMSCLQGFSELCARATDEGIKKYCNDITLHLLRELAEALAKEGVRTKDIHSRLMKWNLVERYRESKMLSESDTRFWKMYFEHRKYFVVKCRCMKIIEGVLRMVLLIPAVSACYERRKYPMDISS